MRKLVPVLALASLVPLSLAIVAPRPARACGGFFCNAQNQVPVLQSGERVLFARHDGLVTMHIEVGYQGDPTQFGWLLPVPDPPKDALGQPLPLDRAVAISSLALFPRLQAATDPRFVVEATRAPDVASCQQSVSYQDSYATALTQDATTAADASSGGSPSVVVLEEAKVGPYDAQLIHADDVDALYAWLAEHGYTQDPAARPVLESYVVKGYEFIGIRLQSGKTTGDLRPLAISLGEEAPCVPLRLTGIAALRDMPIHVWVLGPARAVPKNFIHATLDDMAFSFPDYGSYADLVAQAVDTASGRAWVTEYAGYARDVDRPKAIGSDVQSAVRAAGSAVELVRALGLVISDPDVVAALRSVIAKPPDLRGYPWECRMCAECPQLFCPDPNDVHLTTDGEFYGFLEYWLGRADELGIVVDTDALRARLEAEVFAPRQAIVDLFDGAAWLTRFFTTIDPSEMTRDPIFAFNAELPSVSNEHRVKTVEHADAACDRWLDITYADGRRWRADCPSYGCGYGIGPVPGVDPLQWAEVLDESGDAVPFAEAQVGEVDRLMDGAAVGAPTLPSTFAVTPAESPPQPAVPPPPGKLTSEASAADGCAGGGSGLLAPIAGVLLFACRRKRTLPPRAGLL
ncbi:MAG: DUF2330 domain-containing protein [Myxococcota bacterium]